MRRNLLRVYVRAGLTDRGLDLLQQADLRTASYTEVLGKTKAINFYDLSLLADLAAVYGQASLAHLEKAGADARLKATADYYLGEAYADAGSVDLSHQAVGAFLAAAGGPPQYRDRARIRQAANQYLRGRRAEAMGVWDELAQRQPADPDLLAETILACVRVKADCPKIELRAALAAEAGRGRTFSPLNFALGRYHLWKKDYAKALSYMEAGRDKSNKNKIEANDPVLLVSLAEAYSRTKQFSESLEIFFEMSKQFPVVRQIQEALQGIYSIEHKSAGDVKIF
jgi:tetratricopeptide (TPR) repeat protein